MESLLKGQSLKVRFKKFWSQNFFWIAMRLKEKRQALKGSLTDPFSYLGVGLLVLIVLTIFSFPLDDQGRFYFSFIQGDSKNLNQGLFVSPVNSLTESPDLNLIQGTGLRAFVPPVIITPQVLGTWGGLPDYEVVRREIIEYVVKEGDTIEWLAEKFNISQDTILWANQIKGGVLTPGQKLTILPQSGALHLVRQNDTLGEIAIWYKANIADIIDFNEITESRQIFAGDLLIIPEGIKPASLPLSRASQSGTRLGFIPPIVPGRYVISQRLHYYNAIDFAAPCGTAVRASAAGTVQRTGYGPVGGNYVRIIHANGIVTYYGHLQSSSFVRSGQKVSQGQTIGHIGLTGYTTGCHVHFEYRSPSGAVNPFAS